MLAFSYSLVVADFFLRAFVLILSQKLYKYTFLYDFVSNAFFPYLVPINRRFSTLVEISFSQSNGSFIGLKKKKFLWLACPKHGLSHGDWLCVSALYYDLPFCCLCTMIWLRSKNNLASNLMKVKPNHKRQQNCRRCRIANSIQLFFSHKLPIRFILPNRFIDCIQNMHNEHMP